MTTTLLLTGCKSASTADVVITNVSVVDVEQSTIIESVDISISGGRITGIGPSGSDAPRAARTVDGTGLFAVPGLWDMHVHALWDSTAATDLLPLFVANGVTGIRDMGGSLEVRAYVDSLVDAGDLVAPTIVAAGPMLDGPIPIDPSISEAVRDSAHAVEIVDSLATSGADFIKVYTLLSANSFKGVIEAATRLGLPVVGHLPVDVSLQEAIDGGMASLEHLNEGVEFICQPGECAALAPELLRSNMYQTPTLSIIRSKARVGDSLQTGDARLQYMPPYLLSMWTSQAERSIASLTAEGREKRRKKLDAALEIVGELNDAGVPLLAGSDTGDLFAMPGFSLLDELGLLTEAGLSENQALASATINAARFFGQEDKRGNITVGSVADIVLLRANPLDNIDAVRNIESVILRGQVFDRAALDELLSSRDN